MQIETFDIFYGRSLGQLKEEIFAYKNDENLWKLPGDVKNSPGTLVLHLCGNLKHNVGAILGNNGFIRERDKEFSRRDVSKDELIKEIDDTKEIITPVLKNLRQEDLAKPFPGDQFHDGDTKVSTGWVMARLLFHFGYHLGQINYHRRILEG